RCITAQAMRAVLFASATATTRGGRRWRSPITHGSALVAFDRSKLALAPLIRSRRKYWLPRLDIPPRRCLPPVEFCRGTRPSQAANSRPLRKPLGSTTVAAMAVAMIGHSSLLVSRLDRHKAHRRALNRLADRFRIGGIVLVALDVRLHVLRRH